VRSMVAERGVAVGDRRRWVSWMVVVGGGDKSCCCCCG
jgi:hypothetical protein